MIISFTGKKRSGKSEASKILRELGFVTCNFKDALVKEIKKNFPDLLMEMANVYVMSVDRLFTEKPPLIRKLLQNYGTDFRRKEDSNYWVKKWLSVVLGLDDVVVDDVRFLNEASAVKYYNGIVIKIIRDGCEGDGHISETEMDKIVPDYIIENNGSIDDLINEVNSLYKNLYGERNKNKNKNKKFR